MHSHVGDDVGDLVPFLYFRKVMWKSWFANEWVEDWN